MTTGVGRGGFVKIQGKHLPTGYWGRYSGVGVDARIRGDQSIFKMLKAHIDKVLGAGLAADLWREVPQAAIQEATPIPGIEVVGFSHRTPQGTGTLVLTVAGAARQVTWTPPGGTISPVVDIRAGGIFRLESSGTYLTISVGTSCALPDAGGPYSNAITFSRSLLHTPNFNPQVDQTTVTNAVYPLCSCYKQTSKQPDGRCRSCYGTGIVPGYTKFGYHELHCSSIDPALTLANTSLYTEFTPYRLQLNAGSLTGTITSPVYTVEAPGIVAAVNPVQFRADTYVRQPAGTAVVVTVSINGGGYVAVSTLPGLSVPAGQTLQFRVTLTRTLAADKSPFFEMLRVRYARLDDPFVRLLKGRPTRTRARGAQGVEDSDGNLRFWTVPLRHFDDTIDQDPDVVAPPEVNLIQQKAFVEFREGVHVGARFDCTAFDYDDPKGIFISQGFSCRRPQRDEIIGQVF
jgi:hypothetical protein